MNEPQVQIQTIHYLDSGTVTVYETVGITTVRALEEIEYNHIMSEALGYMEYT